MASFLLATRRANTTTRAHTPERNVLLQNEEAGQHESNVSRECLFLLLVIVKGDCHTGLRSSASSLLEGVKAKKQNEMTGCCLRLTKKGLTFHTNRRSTRWCTTWRLQLSRSWHHRTATESKGEAEISRWKSSSDGRC